MATAHHADAHDDHPLPTGWRRFVYSTNHKDIGTMYLIFAIIAGLIGGALSIGIRLELQEPGVQWFAGDEHLYNVFVTALPGIFTKEPPEVSLKESGVPVFRLSDDAGGFVRWADGGKTITWSLGSTFYRLPLHSAVEFARGCNFKCDFCSITAFHGASQNHRPACEVAAEMAATGSRRFFIVDDNLVSQPARARELCRELIPLKIHWVGQASIHIAGDTELLGLMAKSGCLGVLIGMESLDPANLRDMGKGKALRPLRRSQGRLGQDFNRLWLDRRDHRRPQAHAPLCSPTRSSQSGRRRPLIRNAARRPRDRRDSCWRDRYQGYSRRVQSPDGGGGVAGQARS